MNVPFFRPSIDRAEEREVIEALRSGWVTSGPRVQRFEREFATAVGAGHAVALNSCTAALHLAVEALRLGPGEAVLVPTMTFAASAEVVRYQGAIPLLVDCDPTRTHIDLADAERKIEALRAGKLLPDLPPSTRVVGMITVHVGGLMLDVEAARAFAERHGLWVVEDAAHAFPAAWRPERDAAWVRCGEGTARVTCYSFYANKPITTGEGGMAVTEDAALAERMRLMSLHGLSQDAWGRYSGSRQWDYRIVAPGYKYNLTDIAAALGIHQLARAEEMRLERERIARHYLDTLSDVEVLELPPEDADRIHSWHLFPVRLRLERLRIDRDAFIDELKERGVGCSVHWRPLHLHPYYTEEFGWGEEQLPVASAVWRRLISLPIFPYMREEELEHVVTVMREICARQGRG